MVRKANQATPDIGDLLTDFLNYKRSQGTGKNTVGQYGKEIEYFFRSTGADLSNLRPHFLEYLSLYQNPYTFNIKLTYCGAFFRWLVEEGILEADPSRGLKKRKATPRVPQRLTMNHIDQILKLCDKTTFSGLRDYGLILFSVDTGARPSEATSMLPEDVNMTNMEAYIRSEESKTRISRTLPMSYRTCRAIKDLVRARSPEWPVRAPLFCTFSGKRMSIQGWRHRLHMYGEAIGVRIRPYDLRHLFALSYLRNGATAFHVQKMLGHEGLEMTRRYIALSDGDQKEMHAQASPVESLRPTGVRVRKV